jgi:hypothetical protein
MVSVFNTSTLYCSIKIHGLHKSYEKPLCFLAFACFKILQASKKHCVILNMLTHLLAKPEMLMTSYLKQLMDVYGAHMDSKTNKGVTGTYTQIWQNLNR